MKSHVRFWNFTDNHVNVVVFLTENPLIRLMLVFKTTSDFDGATLHQRTK